MKHSKAPLLGAGVAGAMVAIWLGMAVAPGAAGGLRGMLAAFSQAVANPLALTVVPDTGRCVLVCLFVYGLALLVLVSDRMNFRRGEEYGSARWGNPRVIDRKYRDRKDPSSNLILTQHVAIGNSQAAMYRHRRNLNTVVIGGSGAGKSTSHVMMLCAAGCPWKSGTLSQAALPRVMRILRALSLKSLTRAVTRLS